MAATTNTINLFTILTFITSISGKIPQAMKLIQLFIELFADPIAAATPSDSLQVAELSPEESALVEQITQAISADGTQAVLDLAKLRQFAVWLNSVASSPLGKALIALLSGGLTA